MKKYRRTTAESNASSMADIAFLLLIFFMVTTTIVNDKGLDLVLPPFDNSMNPAEIHDRNLFSILINSNDKLMVEEELRESVKNLRLDVKKFILNYGANNDLSESPAKAVISLKTNRGTSQNQYIQTLDEVKAAYYEIYSDKLNIESNAIRNNKIPIQQQTAYRQLRKEIPMNISIAEPD
ncbi:MAG: biopolymer transporter ExbD [Fulvivirga sp.]|uniref:ExbD/TolR family protein n=1 Tax=Fulvivirga sp. TaxID=1931237 RepID=UPI0032ED29B6